MREKNKEAECADDKLGQLRLDRTFHEWAESSEIRQDNRVRPDEIKSAVVMFEVYKKAKKLKGEQGAIDEVAVVSQTNTVPIDNTISLEAADYSLEYGLPFFRCSELLDRGILELNCILAMNI